MKPVTYQELGRLSADFSAKPLQARREWDDVLKMVKEKNANQECSIWQNYPLEMKVR